jgi:PPM family protein phosphatase
MAAERVDEPAETAASMSDGDNLTIVDCAVVTDGGPIRGHNEDHCLALEPLQDASGFGRCLLAVADGLGGLNAGEVASELAITAVEDAFRQDTTGSLGRWMRRTFQRANLAVFDRAHSDPSCRSMQTTLTVWLIEGNRVAIGHVGDCRVYRFRHGEVRQLTQDHTRLLDLLRVRLVTAEQAITHPARHMLTRSLGAEPIVAVDVMQSIAEEGDTYVICSDGVWNALSRGNLRRLIVDLPAAEACRRLIDLGNMLGADDNISVGVAHIRRVGPGRIVVTPFGWLRSRFGRLFGRGA